ncbi:MAG: glutamine--fructose-6-phosphate transaminase (isomerizing) [Bacilli bacterium]
MCGIVGYIGKNSQTLKYLITGLKSLEYRGYDSAGIAYVTNKINIIKEQGRLENLEKIIDLNKITNLAIGHTRWATHGKPTKNNAHPHKIGKITIVHNGIIENYEELKKALIIKGYQFTSDTDTEIACAVIDNLYKNNNNMLKTLQECLTIFKGSYAIGIINDDDYNHLYAIKKDSPLIIGHEQNGFFIASDVPAILKYTKKYYLIENNEIISLSTKSATFYDQNLKKVTKNLKTYEQDIETAMKNGYEHFMLKEINEQPTIIENIILNYIKDDKKSLKKQIPDLSKYKNIHIVACGSAYHTGLIGKTLIEQYANIPVSVEIASEYRYQKNFYNQDTIVIFISQSGETADTLACLRKVKENNIATLAIINVVDSSIAREADHTIYLKAGCEIAVATTKAYLAQASILSLIALNTAINKKTINNITINNIFKEINTLPNLIKQLINKETYKKISNKIYKKNNIFFIGRGIDQALAKEGALKLKEISYVHCEAYAAGELKHGSISLIEKNTPVIAIVTDENIANKTISNIKEVKARGAYVILITTTKLNKESDFYDEKIVIPTLNSFIEPLLSIIPLQLLSYEIAKLRGCDIDKPRNLAKSVTVE